MADIKINLRASSGYVTDGAGFTYCLDTDTYPTTRNGWTFGITGPVGSRDRDAGVSFAPENSGILFRPTGATCVLQVDLVDGAGTYEVRLAMGDAGSPQTNSKIIVKDNTTVLTTIGPHSPATADFYDATDTLRANAAGLGTWKSLNAAATLTFATTTAIFSFEDVGGTTVLTCVQFHLTGAGPSFMPRPNPYRGQAVNRASTY